jgi:hypothetical protein
MQSSTTNNNIYSMGEIKLPILPTNNPNSNTITAENIKPTTSIPLASNFVDPNTYYNKTNNVALDLANSVNTAQKTVDEFNSKGKIESEAIANLQSLLGGKAKDTNEIYNSQGVNNLYNQLSDLNAQATGLKNEASAIPIQIQKEFTGTGATDAGVAPIQSARLRDNALKALSLGQQAAIVSSQYEKAKNYSDQIIDAKYTQIEADIKAKLTNLASLKEFDLTPAQEKLRIEQEKKLRADEIVLNDQKTNEKGVSDLVINASSQNAPKDLINKAMKARTPAEAASILGTYAGDYWKQKQLEREAQLYAAPLNTNVPVGQLNKDSGVDLDKFKNAIAGVESAGSGDYKALGPIMASGSLKGDRAYGKYQVMGANVPVWTKEALGFSMTPQQFLNSPDAQEAVANYQFNKNYEKYGNWDDVASVWFSGRPVKGNNSNDGYNSVSQYVQKVRKNLVGSATTGQSNYQTEYQRLDKFKKANADQILDQFTKESSIWTNVTKAQNAVQTADEIIKNPKNAAAQISLLYGFVAGLDPNSAVKEGEIALAGSVASNLSNLQNAFTKISQGQPIPADSAIQLANETKRLAQQWANAGLQQENKLLVKARTQGVESVIKGYLTDVKALNGSTPSVGNTTSTGNVGWDSFLNSTVKIYGNANTTPSLSDYGSGFTRN